jgi:hypothetical protein
MRVGTAKAFLLGVARHKFVAGTATQLRSPQASRGVRCQVAARKPAQGPGGGGPEGGWHRLVPIGSAAVGSNRSPSVASAFGQRGAFFCVMRLLARELLTEREGTATDNFAEALWLRWGSWHTTSMAFKVPGRGG